MRFVSTSSQFSKKIKLIFTVIFSDFLGGGGGGICGVGNMCCLYLTVLERFQWCLGKKLKKYGQILLGHF